jgi:crotonobetainyl-CoA:carnitine CoA-transferase CaiB-like acyl-CoA transferase
VRGTGQGERGPDADKGSYDSLAFWARAGVAAGARRPEYDLVPLPPAPGFGDSIGAMTIAGGIMGALFHRERTGEGTTVDVSLLGTGLWSHGASLALSLQHQVPWAPVPKGTPTGNPLTGTYRTSDDRYLSLTCLQAAKYWPLLCDVIDRPDLAADGRFADAAGLKQNAAVAAALLADVFAQRPAGEWRERLSGFSGQWAMVQDTLEAAADPQTVANGYVAECHTADGTPFRLAAAPVQFGDEAAVPRRAPEFNEHGDEILADLGLDQDTILDLKIRGIVA